MIKEFNQFLYRYDLKKPPADWDTDFVSSEYEYCELGHKNKAKLFFFTDSQDIAKDLGAKAAEKYSKTEYFLTSTQCRTQLKLIDFSSCHNIFHILCLLEEMKINVLTDSFKTFEGNDNFSLLLPIFESAHLEENPLKKLKIITGLKVHSKSDYNAIGLFGQRLTDFGNGIEFKKIVKTEYREIDGYLWQEFDDDRGFTYCLFDSEKLSAKTTEKIEIIK